MADIDYAVADHIATITLNRPQRKNAFTLEMIDTWANALIEAEHDPNVRVVVLTGAGDRSARVSISRCSTASNQHPSAPRTS